MKIVSISVVRGIPSGIAKQLEYEDSLSGELPGVRWRTLMYSTECSPLPFVRQIPFVFRPLLLRNLYGWIVALRECKDVDYVLMRHMTFDLFGVLVSPMISNRVSVHHAIEPVELKQVRVGWKGRAASFVELITGFLVISNSAGILAVTREIAQYENSRVKGKKHVGLYPNGINPNSIDASDDRREAGEINAVFICQEFSKWHGLEKLILDANRFEPIIGNRLIIHLIGEISPEQRRMISLLPQPSLFVIHGALPERSYRALFAIATVGIGSLALEEEGLTEASPLKVREYLASGLPVYSGHIDPAFPADFPFYKFDTTPTLKGLYWFANSMINEGRHTVRSSSIPYISKLSSMQSVIKYLDQIDLARRTSS